MIDVNMRFEGGKELAEQLKELGEEMREKVIARAMRKAFKPVLEQARATVPVDTGLLRDSLKLATVKPKNAGGMLAVGIVVVTGKGGSRKDIAKAAEAASGRKAKKKARKEAGRKSAHWRWRWVEKGTPKMKATPFLRPALDGNASNVLEAFRADLERAVKRALRRKARGR